VCLIKIQTDSENMYGSVFGQNAHFSLKQP